MTIKYDLDEIFRMNLVKVINVLLIYYVCKQLKIDAVLNTIEHHTK